MLLKPLKKLSICALFPLVFALPTEAGSCPSFQEALALYGEGQIRVAQEILECRAQNHPNDYDSLKLLSDLYWREGNTKASVKHSELLCDKKLTDYYRVPACLRIARFRVYGLGFFVKSSRSKSYEVWAGASARYYKKNQLRFEYSRDSRKYKASTRQTDQVYRLGHIGVLSQNLYFDSVASYSRDPHFSQNWSIRVEPHFIWSGVGDVSLGVEYKNYDSEDVISQRASWSRQISALIWLRAQLDWTLKPERTLSFSELVAFQWSRRLQTQLRFGGGKTDEGSGLVDDFFSVGGSIHYRVMIPLLLKLSAAYHQGDIREETRFGGGLELAF